MTRWWYRSTIQGEGASLPPDPKPSAAAFYDAAARLGAQPVTAPFESLSSAVGPVSVDGCDAFLKVTNEPEELAGTRALQAWDGTGAVRVLAHHGNAILLERGGRPLRSLALGDDAATTILCDVADKLHTQRPAALGEFRTLRSWFASLFTDTTTRFAHVRTIADQLLTRPAPPVLLHGDLHHENVLDGAGRGWLAIDPKGIVGPREFDYCNIFTNWDQREAVRNFDSRLHIVSRTADIDRVDLLAWIACWSALSGIWHREDGHEQLAEFAHSIMDVALGRLARMDTSSILSHDSFRLPGSP